MQDEFEKLIGGPVGAGDWDVVSEVYTFHPLIPNLDGKRRAADLWRLGGAGLFRDLLPKARRVREAEDRLRACLRAERLHAERKREVCQRLGQEETELRRDTREAQGHLAELNLPYGEQRQ